MSESLRNDGRVWVPKRAGDDRAARPDPRERARLLPRAPLSQLRQPRAARHRLAGRQGGVRRGPRGRAGRAAASTSTSPTPSSGSASATIRERYGNLFEMYQRITDENPYELPMRIFPAVHYTMGGLWVDYNLMSTIPGPPRDRRGQLLRPRRQPARRERAHAGAGRRLLHPAEHGQRLPGVGARPAPVDTSHAEFRRVEAEVAERTRTLPRDQGQADGGLVPPRARPHHVGPVRHGAERRGPAGGAGADPRAPRGVLAERQRARAATRSSTRRWRRPAGWPTSWSSASSCAATRSIARSRAAATSARSTRPRTARPCATTSTSPTSRPGSTPATCSRPGCTKEPLAFEYVHLAQRSYK